MRKLVSVLLTVAVVLGLSLVAATPVAAQDDPILILENKYSSNWTVIEDGIQGTLVYFSTGPEFKFKFNATGLTSSTNYSLIYYADKPDRFVEWGGDNPGALIANFTTDGSGDIAATSWQSVELNMDLPCHPDANIDEYDYSGPPDNYTHAHGAKIWLVPTVYLPANWPNDGAWMNWNATIVSEILFETDLISYTDTGSSVSLTAEVLDIVAISVDPASIDYGTLLPGDTSDTKIANVTNIGTHTVDVDAEVVGDTLFEDNLQLVLSSSWTPGPTWLDVITGLAMGKFKNVSTRLVVPLTYTPSGTETSTLIFTASAA